MTKDKDHGTYEVGYKKPPRNNRFKPGQSGNPKGRPKHTRNLRTDLTEELGQKVKVTENGRTRTLSKQQIMIKSLVTNAAKGGPRATEKVLDLMLRIYGLEEEVHRSETPVSEADHALIKAFMARYQDDPDD